MTEIIRLTLDDATETPPPSHLQRRGAAFWVAAVGARRFEAAAAELHQRVDKKSLTKMDDLNKTLASLELERAALQRIPTWPWDAGTPRGLAVTLVLPLVIWLAQYLLQRLLP